MARPPAPSATFAITGATGFLGSRLAHALHARGHLVLLFKRSTSDTSRIASLLPEVPFWDVDVAPVADAFAAHEIECVVHCATDYGRRPDSLAAVLEANLLLPLRLLESAVAHEVPFFVNVDTLLDGDVNAYALAKRQIREWLPLFAASIGIVNVALSSFYGAGDDPEKFVPSLVHQALSGARRIALTPGEQERDFVHVDDVVAAFLTVFDDLGRRRGCVGPDGPSGPALRYEVGTGRPVSIRDLATAIRRLSGRSDLQLDFGVLCYRPGEVMRVCADIGPLEQLGWAPRIGLEEGLSRTLREESALACQAEERR
ncbi:MAG: NAD-dependent epimerase/dehydratase family protein [Planctomycetia bacterium]